MALVKSLFPERFDTELHPRKIIRDAVAARLSTPVNPLAEVENQRYWTPAGPKVFARKELELTFDDMPLILVRFGGERVIEQSKSNFEGFDQREVELLIESYVVVDPSASADDKLDEMAYYVEAAFNGFKLSHYSADMLLQSTEYEFDFDSSQPIAMGRQTYAVRYICPRLSVDFGLWDRDGACIVNTGRQPPVSEITVSSNFGDDVYEVDQ